MSENDENSIDHVDLVLLSMLQKDALASTEQLGSAVGLSATAAKRRVNKLRKNGVITKDVSVVHPESVGFEIFSLVFVTLERDRRDIVHNFKKSISQNPRITSGFYTTGEADFVLFVASKSLADYDAFTQEFFWENPNIKNFKTMVVLDRVKSGFELPLL
ncbi:Lrp/AsnC family transcriptional regulator [Reinekea sp.]|jgi:Lrp/AsnC family leucine-responsive transcriptional regulator|uniref:Lrp/AsnC family transcriptional regulator n=1 Tax=Reinekea sp. TaxID=1970455 RepID=UPI002A818FE0|nr:Lrp/AsnC family transcriptional regulator [Reinekea sp.]